jgi:dsDNA-specific endonuclease/ATPase MutS2
MRVSVAVEDLEPATSGHAPETAGGRPRTMAASGGTAPGSGTGIGALQLARARTVASSLDLRGARVDEALDALSRYLDDAALAGLDQVTIIHGLGTGALRDAVRAHAGSHPLVRSFRPGERGEGGDGATIVRL